ncbi:MAG: hypothetical protein ACTS27_09080 [Phycisphaerales bacterium]
MTTTLSLASWFLPGVFALGSLALACVAVWMARRASKNASASDQAFDALAKHMGATRAERRAVRDLAAHDPNATPAALLVSEHAYRKAYDAQRERLSGDPKRAKRAADMRAFAERVFKDAA